jgi:hypothetical protein
VTLKPHFSLYQVLILGLLMLLWLAAIFWLGPPPEVIGLRKAVVILAFWSVLPSIWFVIDDYVFKSDPTLNRLQRYARGLWIAVGAVTFILILRTIIVNHLPTTRGPVAWNLVVDVVRLSIWPVVVLVSLALFRTPLGDFFSALGRRASKIGAFNVSIELTNLPEAQQMSVINLNDLKSENPMAAADSSGSLFKAIAETTQADYVTVNLEDGEAWVTSRLFILAVLVPRVRPIKRIVFLSGPSEEFLGEARPADLVAALAANYQWLEEAYIESHVYAYQQAPNN